MTKRAPLILLAATLALAGAPVAGSAQTTPSSSSTAGPATGNSNVTSEGAHTPLVGASKSNGVTPLDRKEERKERKETSICKGC